MSHSYDHFNPQSVDETLESNVSLINGKSRSKQRSSIRHSKKSLKSKRGAVSNLKSRPSGPLSELEFKQQSMALSLANQYMKKTQQVHHSTSQHFSTLPRQLIKPLFKQHPEYLQSTNSSRRQSPQSHRANPKTVGGVVTAQVHKHAQTKGTMKYVPLSAFGKNEDGQVRIIQDQQHTDSNFSLHPQLTTELTMQDESRDVTIASNHSSV